MVGERSVTQVYPKPEGLVVYEKKKIVMFLSSRTELRVADSFLVFRRGEDAERRTTDPFKVDGGMRKN